MPLTFFIYISFILTAVLLFYGLSILVFSLIYGSNKRKAKIEANSFKKSVEIIIPCHNEGREVIDTIESLSSQTYSAPKNIFLLVCDETDSSIPFITEKYGLISEKPFYLKNNTKFFVILTGVKGKKEKLNYHLPHLSSDYVALLDADHVATHSWLSQSIVLLEKTEKNVCGVQSRREPKSLKNFFQIWDSAQNHIGNELLNISLEKAKLPIFFTGTTAVFKKNTFDNLVFSDSITEDTYLSYDLLLQGKELIYNKLTGSRESVSPTLSDYIARRRRWSNGHTQNFFKHLKEIIFSPILLSKRKSLLFVHGIFFLIPIVAIILLNIFQGFYFFQYSNNIKFFVLDFILLLISFILSRYSRFISVDILQESS